MPSKVKIIQVNDVKYQFKHKFTSDDQHRISLSSSNAAALESIGVSLCEFTKKIDPTLDASVEVVRVDSSEGTPFALNLEKIIPQHILAILGKHTAHAMGNCHGAALFVSGIFPILTKVRGSVKGHRSSGHCILVQNDVLLPGDILSIEGSDDHSLVYINSDLCLSMNGCNQDLEFCSLIDVLKAYLTPEEFSCAKNSDGVVSKEFLLSLKRYRNDHSTVFPKTFLNLITEFYTLYRKPIPYQLKTDGGYLEMKKSYQKLFLWVKQQREDSPYWRCFVERLDWLMPFTITGAVFSEWESQKTSPETPEEPPELYKNKSSMDRSVKILSKVGTFMSSVNSTKGLSADFMQFSDFKSRL